MEEQKEHKEHKEEETPLQKVQSNYDKLKEANDKVEAELLRGQELKAKIALGGETNTEAQKPQPSKEDKKVSDAKEMFKGTALGDAITRANE
jgi:hypothetical protein